MKLAIGFIVVWEIIFW